MRKKLISAIFIVIFFLAILLGVIKQIIIALLRRMVEK